MSNEYKDWIADKEQEAQELIRKYPFIRIDDNYTYLDDIPVGWADAFGEKMCEDLSAALGDYANEFVILQMKEKYAQLRIYHAGCPDDIYDKVEKVISKYEDLSEKTCFDCGKPATKFTSGWILPVCDDCYKEYQNEFSQ